MARRVAVQDGLENVKQALQKQGIEVTKLTNGTMDQIDAAVVTGMTENAMGIADTNNKYPVIECNGMTAQEVVNTLQARWSRLQEEA